MVSGEAATLELAWPGVAGWSSSPGPHFRCPFTCARHAAELCVAADAADGSTVNINHPARLKADLPFGGVKISGYGHELAHLGIEEFINKKLINVVPIDAPA